jgi:chromosomal replication initiator protein
MTQEPQKIWQYVLEEIEKEVSRANFLTLFKQTSLVSFSEEIATIAAPSPMIVDMLQKRFSERIKIHIDTITGIKAALLFIIKSPQLIPQTDMEHAPLFVQKTESAPLIVGHLPRVRPDFTFPNFAVSSTNQLAFVSASTVAANPGTSYNPFFIYGPVGVGKTHLMHAIANEVYQKQPDGKIIYITSEEFTNEVVEAIRTNETSKMKKRFRSAVLLLIDDIQFIEGKERVQEELFHTFNILIDQGAQIVLSSDRPPEEIKKLEKRLSSRFAGGLTVDIGAPDFELKTAILLIKANKYNVDLPIEVAKYLAEQATDARSLEGLLLRLLTIATTQNIPITVKLASQALGKEVQEGKQNVHADDIIKCVCDFYSVKPTQLRGPKREASLVRARQVTMYLLKHKLSLTLVEIGNLLGGRDHTTIMHGVGKIENLVENKATIHEDILRITKQLYV